MERFAPLVTERLVVRRLHARDVAAVVAYRSDPQVARYQGWTAVDPGEVARYVADLDSAEPADRPGPWFQLAIEERAGGELAGDCAVRLRSDEPGTAEIGYTLAPRFHGRGYATEAMASLCGWLFAVRRVRRVVAISDARNLPSIRVLERLGMRRIACVETKLRGERTLELTFELRRP